MHRRQLLIGAAGLAVALAAPAIVHAKTRLRLGYLHVVAVDGQIWTGIDRGSFERNGIDFELSEFNTGPEVFEALAAGTPIVATDTTLWVASVGADYYWKSWNLASLDVIRDPQALADTREAGRAYAEETSSAAPTPYETCLTTTNKRSVTTSCVLRRASLVLRS